MANENQQHGAVAVADATGTRSSYPKTRRIRFRFGQDGTYGKYFFGSEGVLVDHLK